MTVVVGTAGHIDHGKTALLVALTGMDADRLPDEKRRGLTIDVGYARGAPDDGAIIDYVDVPGHDRLVGNMLVGAGEIDACLLVVAADDGPRAQTLEHLGLLDALGIRRGLIVLTKIDLVDGPRIVEVRSHIATLVADTSLAASPVVAVSSTDGRGLDVLRLELGRLRDAVVEQQRAGRLEPSTMSIDRVFSARGHGVVVTGSARGAPFREGQRVRVEPGASRARIRGIHVHDSAVEEGPTGGRVALNISGPHRTSLRRGQVVLADDSNLATSSRLLVSLSRPTLLPGRSHPPSWPPRDGTEARLHLRTDQTDAIVGRGGRDRVSLDAVREVAVLRLTVPVATRAGDRFVLRQPHPADLLAGGVVLDPAPVRGPSRKRQTPQRLMVLDEAVRAADPKAVSAALLALRGVRIDGTRTYLADDVGARLEAVVASAVEAFHAAQPERPGMPLAALRATVVAAMRRLVTASPSETARASDAVIARSIASGELSRAGDAVHRPRHRPPARDRALDRAGERLIALLDVPAPPALSRAAAEAGCPARVIDELERDGRIIMVDDDLAWARAAHEALTALALQLARDGPMTPAALRDASGTSRKYVMPLLEDLVRRGILTRTAAGHVPGPRA